MFRPDEIPKILREINKEIERLKQANQKKIIFVPICTDLKKWPIPLLLTALIFGEARNQPDVAKIGVGFVIINRAKKGGWFGKDHKEVMLKPKQFSCFNKDDPNYKKIFNPLYYEPAKVWIRCWEIAMGVLEERFIDPTYRADLGKSATYYFDKSLKNNPPSWAKELTFLIKIGDLYFYG